MQSLLKHELSHLFGAADLNDKGSIMNNKNLGHKFDEFTTRVILLNKNRDFNPYVFPLPKNKLNEAISLYNQRKEINPREPNVNILLALLYLEKRDYKSAIKECFQAIQVDPNLPEAYSLSGIAYRREGKIDLAISAYHKVLLSQPRLPELYQFRSCLS
jgi:tetratricopeptide (TPR) repeat protein